MAGLDCLADRMATPDSAQHRPPDPRLRRLYFMAGCTDCGPGYPGMAGPDTLASPHPPSRPVARSRAVRRRLDQIGSASCWVRVCPYVYVLAYAVPLNNKT